jgi:hypothetical protein
MAKKRETPRKEAAPRSGDAPSPTGGGAPSGVPDVPVWLPAAVFGALTLWLFRAFVFSDQMLVGNDTLSLGYVARDFYAEALKQMRTFPLWNPRILGGTPFLEALSGGDSLYPPSAFLLLILEPYRALGWKLVLHVLAAGFFMYGWLRSLKSSPAAALVAGVGYMLAPAMVSFVRPGHDGKLFVAALAPLMFWVVERHFARPGLRSFAGVGLVVALVLLTTHFQAAYFLFGAVGVYAMFRSVQQARQAPGSPARVVGRFGLFLTASVVGAAAAGVQFIPAAEYVTNYSRRVQTTRAEAGEVGRAWSSSWSLHPEEAMSLVLPEFAGNNAGGSNWTNGTYWGRNGTRDNMPTAGVLVLLLATVSLAGGARGGIRWFFMGLGGVALLFALGSHTPVWGLFYALLPGVSLFRAPDTVMFLFAFAAATLGGLGFQHLLETARDDLEDGWRRPLRVLWVSTAFLALLWILAASGVLQSLWSRLAYPDIGPGQLQVMEAIRPFVARGAFFSTLLAAGVTGLAWAVRRGVLAPTALLAGTVILVAVDQLRIDGSFVQVMDFHTWAQPDPNIQTILDREQGRDEPYRLLSFAQAGQDVKPAMYGIELAAGHHPNDLSRYRELIGMVGSDEAVNLYDPDIRRLLNVRYMIWPDLERGELEDQPGVISRTRLPDGRAYETLLAEGGLPRARLVGAAVVKSDEEAVPYMLSEAFDPRAEVVLNEAPPVALDGAPVTGEVRWEERSPNRLRLSVTNDRPALLVVADNWFPAWQATVDGADTPVLRAYHTLRAVPVPAGSHTVEMRYHSALLVRSMWISILALACLLALGIMGTLAERRRAA